MDHVIQVELRTGKTHTMTWLNAAMKLKPGVVLLCDDDPRLWTVVHASHIMAHETMELHTHCKVGT